MKEEPHSVPNVPPGEPPVSHRPTLTPEVARHAMNPTHLGHISHPDGTAHLRGDCGDALEVLLLVRDGRIVQARFDALGCGFTVACGNVAMELAEGRPLDEAMGIEPERICERLGGLPTSLFHSAELATESLRMAIRDCLLRARSLVATFPEAGRDR